MNLLSHCNILDNARERAGSENLYPAVFGKFRLPFIFIKSIIWEKSGTNYFPGVIEMKQVHIRIDDDLYNELSYCSARMEQTMQDCVREAVAYYVTDMRKKQREVNDRQFTFIDLFAGIGGMRIAFEKAGGHCVYSNEWNKYSRQTYFANFGEQPEGDITQVSASSIPDHDILVAGFPCQPFSIAGISKKNSLGRATGFEDKTQGTLFFDVCRILKEKRPKAFMLENVKNLCSHDRGRTFKVILESLDELDYEVFCSVEDGQNYVPQHRERILIVGFNREKYGEKVKFDFKLTPKCPKPVMRDILDENVDEKYTLSDKLWTYLQNYAAKHKAAGNGFGYGIAPLDGVSRTISARYYKDGSEILIEQEGKNPRRLTPRECARLQGFPDDFKIPVSDTQAYKQFGNSVVVPLMENVAKLIVKKVEEMGATGGHQSGILISKSAVEMMSLIYKRALPEDIDILTKTRIEVLRAANQLSDETDMSGVERESRNYYRRALRDGSHIAYLVFDGKCFVGAGGVSFFQVMPTYHNPSGNKAYIMNMYTNPAYRRKGIATKILDMLVHDIKNKGITAISLEATDMGRPLYEKYGFIKMNHEMELPEQEKTNIDANAKTVL